jgi:hypothetical protein
MKTVSTFNSMPEAFALRLFRWEVFATLTFRKISRRGFGARKAILFAWLRDVADTNRVHFKRLIWVAQYEFGRRGEGGHFHLCVAGLRLLPCRDYEALWYRRAGFAQVEPYDKARDGIGYILKRPLRGGSIVEDQYPPMLSDSCFEALRRGRPM